MKRFVPAIMLPMLKPSCIDFFYLDEFSQAEIFRDCFYPWEALSRLPEYLRSLSLGQKDIEIPPGVHLIHPELISIGLGSRIEPGAYIEGPCFIGKNCIIRHGAYLRGHVMTGDNCIIGHDTEIKNSILLNHVCAAHFNYVGDSILGNGVNLGAGVKCANFRLDGLPIFIEGGKEKMPTGMRKLGLIAGDGCKIGCNAVTNPGTVLGREVLCYPCLNIGGYLPAKSRIKPSSSLHKVKIHDNSSS